MIYCDKCGAEIFDEQAKFCSRCGQALVATPSQLPNQQAAQSPAPVQPGTLVTMVPVHVPRPKHSTEGYKVSSALEDLGNNTLASVIPGINILLALWSVALHSKVITHSKRAGMQGDFPELIEFSKARSASFPVEIIAILGVVALTTLRFLYWWDPIYITISFILIPLGIFSAILASKSWKILGHFFDQVPSENGRHEGIKGCNFLSAASFIAVAYVFSPFLGYYGFYILALVIPVTVICIPLGGIGYFNVSRGMRKFWAGKIKAETPPIVGKVYQIDSQLSPAMINDLASQIPQQAVPVETQKPAIKYCTFCGSEIENAHVLKYCSNCGSHIEPGES